MADDPTSQNSSPEAAEQTVGQGDERGARIRQRVAEEVGTRVDEGLDRMELGSVHDEIVAAYKRVTDALPEGAMKRTAEKLEGAVDAAAHVSDLYARGMDLGINIVKAVAAIEVPAVLLIPNNIYQRGMAASARGGGKAGGAGVKGVVKATSRGENGPRDEGGVVEDIKSGAVEAYALESTDDTAEKGEKTQ